MDDERLQKIEQEKQNALNQSNNTYNTMLQDNQNLYNHQNQYANDYELKQNEILDKQLAFQQENIDKQKEIARQNKEEEDKKAKNDYASYINPYGLQAESFASRGLLNSGVSETAQLGAWNSYQNRLSASNKVMQDAFVQYDKDMNEARLNNDVQKAQNALNKLQMQLDFSKDFYNNKNTISQNQLSNNQQLDSDYYNRYQTEYSNIQNELAKQEQIRQWEANLAEQQRQYDKNMEWQKDQARQQQSNWEKEYALSKSTAYARYGNGNGNSISLDDNKTSEQQNDMKGTGLTAKKIGIRNVEDRNQEIVQSGNNFYIWNGKDWLDVTNEVNYYNKAKIGSNDLIGRLGNYFRK